MSFTIIDFRPFTGADASKGQVIKGPADLEAFGGTGLAKIADRLGHPVAGGRYRMKVQDAALKVFALLSQADLPALVAKTQTERAASTKPGVIATLIDLLQNSEDGLTFVQVMNRLTEAFPERDPDKMAVTVRTQLARIPEERGLAMTKTREGRTVRYSLARG